MKLFLILIYNLLVYPLLFFIVVFFAFFNKKIRDAFLGKFQSVYVLKQYFNKIDKRSEIYWFHSSSLGEFYQVKPVLEGLKKIKNDSKCIVSFSSPSGYENAISDSIDLKFYMPFDFPWTVLNIFKFIKPKKIIFSSYDYWPNFIWIAKIKGFHTNIFAKNIKSYSPIFRLIISGYYKAIYTSFSSIYTISNKDNDNLYKMIDKNILPQIKSLGNPRYDMVRHASNKFKIKREMDISKRSKRIIIGSTHKSDDEFLIPALTYLMNLYSDLNIIYAPHEPSPKVLKMLKNKFKEFNYSCMIFNKTVDLSLTNDRVTLINVVGVLSELYWKGIIAYVGGGYSSSGVHNVMEPAAAKLPVLFGPRYEHADEAKQLLANGGGFYVNDKNDFIIKVEQLLLDQKQLMISSLASFDVINKNVGSSNKIINKLVNE